MKHKVVFIENTGNETVYTGTSLEKATPVLGWPLFQRATFYYCKTCLKGELYILTREGIQGKVKTLESEVYDCTTPSLDYSEN